MSDITYATKLWQGDLDALTRHPNADLVIANNTHAKIIDIGKTDLPYLVPELRAINKCETEYILWYSGDVTPPETDWVSDALPHLEKYPIVSCAFDDTPKEQAPEMFDALGVTPDGWTTFYFSDQCYIAKTEFMRNIDYNTEHSVKDRYPEHGGNSFERRVAQYLANKGLPMLVLSEHRYRHITKEEK